MVEGATTYPAWPEILTLAKASEMVSLSESSFRAIYGVLAARFGLRVTGICGPKFFRANLLEVFDRLAVQGLDVSIDQGARTVKIGDDIFPIGTTRSGKSNRGRPPKTKDEI